jgi:hypothetical protein
MTFAIFCSENRNGGVITGDLVYEKQPFRSSYCLHFRRCRLTKRTASHMFDVHSHHSLKTRPHIHCFGLQSNSRSKLKASRHNVAVGPSRRLVNVEQKWIDTWHERQTTLRTIFHLSLWSPQSTYPPHWSWKQESEVRVCVEKQKFCLFYGYLFIVISVAAVSCITTKHGQVWSVAYGGGLGVQTPPPEIAKLWQNWAEFPKSFVYFIGIYFLLYQ